MRFGEDPSVVRHGVDKRWGIGRRGHTWQGENPFAQFRSIQPVEVIDRRSIRLSRTISGLGAVAAIEHIRAAVDFATQHDAEGTIREARIAVNLLTRTILEAHARLGDALAVTGDTRAAQSEYLCGRSSLVRTLSCLQEESDCRASSKDEPLNWFTVRQERRCMDSRRTLARSNASASTHSPTRRPNSVSALSPMHNLRSHRTL